MSEKDKEMIAELLRLIKLTQRTPVWVFEDLEKVRKLFKLPEDYFEGRSRG